MRGHDLGTGTTAANYPTMTKYTALLPIVLLGMAATGCTNDEPTVSGTWTRQSTVGPTDAFDCRDTGLPEDLVSISATDSSGFTYSTQAGCKDGGFAFPVPTGTTGLEIVLQVLPDGGAPPPNTITVAGPIDSDVDLGAVKLAPSM